MASPPRKKLLFKEFVRENESRFAVKYPFLTTQQINTKLKQSWKIACQKVRESRINKSPAKIKNRVCNSKQYSRENRSPFKGVRIPVKSHVKSPSPPAPWEDLAGNEHDGEINETHSNDDSGGWYCESEGTLENSDKYPSPQTNGLTDEIVNDVKSHTLNVETRESYKEREESPVKGEKTLPHLFHPREKRQNKDNSPKISRLLASEEKEGKSNFSEMFHENDDIFM